jgi:hypothetical protein
MFAAGVGAGIGVMDARLAMAAHGVPGAVQPTFQSFRVPKQLPFNIGKSFGIKSDDDEKK